MTKDQRLFWLKRLVLIGLLIGIGMSYPLWLNERPIPLIPVFDFLPNLEFPFDTTLLVILVLLMLVNLVYVLHRFLSWFLIVALLVVMLLDYNRFQAWYWQYLWLLVAIVPYQEYYKVYRMRTHLYQAALISFVGIYIWAGIFKINPFFVEWVIPYVYSPITNYLTTFRDYIEFTGHFVPYSEILLGIGLLLKKTRKVFVLLGMAFHLGIILLFSPLGLDANTIILPWNALMFLALPLLFWGYNESISISVFSKLPNASKVALLVFYLLPILNFFGWYNKSLAFELYSGTNYTRELKWHKKDIKQIPSEIDPYLYSTGDTVYLEPYKWCIETCNVPQNPDPKVLDKMERIVLKKFQ